MANIPLGVYVGNPNGNDSAAEAQFQGRFQNFVTTMGATPTTMNAFVDYNGGWSTWVANAGWTAWSWAQSPVAKTMTPVIGLPMATNADWGKQLQVFQDIAAGLHDDVWLGIVQKWANAGFTTMYVRPGYEMNGSFMPWYAGDDAQTQAAWVKAFQHIADVVHGVPGVSVSVVWNPAQINWSKAAAQALYPGDKYVDVIGADVYSPLYPRDLYDWSKNDGSFAKTLDEWLANPVNRQHYWDYPNGSKFAPYGDGVGWSLLDSIELAKLHGKPIAIPETGAGVAPSQSNTGPVDEGAFPTWLASRLAQPDVPPVAFVNVWDTNLSDGRWDFSSATANKPLEAAAWRDAFGIGAGASHTPIATTLGSGPDILVMTVSEDFWQTDSLYTVSVDGVQVGGTQTAHALHSAHQSDILTVRGDWGVGSHVVRLTYLNDGYGGSATLDRNLYLDGVTYNGQLVPGVQLGITGGNTFTVQDATPSASPASNVTTIGAGSDVLAFKISEDFWQTDSQYTISVDGVQYGSTLTAKALHSAKASDTVLVLGNWSMGQHTVKLTYLNDGYGGSPALDRNLYLDGVTYNGQAVADAKLGITGGQTFTFLDAPPVTAAHQFGTGADTLVLKISEDFWQTDSQYTVSVDGVQYGGILVAQSLHSTKLSDSVTLRGDWAVGPHTVKLTYLNDGYGGSPALDRNLYLDGVTYNGQAVAGVKLGITGGNTFAIQDTSPVPAAITVGTGSDTLLLRISEDYWQTDSQYTISVDGHQVGGILTASAYHSAKMSDTVAVRGDWGIGEHTVRLAYLNDGYGGSPTLDRNLYLDGVTYNGQAVPGAKLGITGGNTFTVLDNTPTPDLAPKLHLSNVETAALAYDPTQATTMVMTGPSRTITANSLGLGVIPGNPSIALDVGQGGSQAVSLLGAWNSLKVAHLESTTGGTFALTNFVRADAILGDGEAHLSITDAKRGDVVLGSGPGSVSIVAKTNSGTAKADDPGNLFTVTTGNGDHDIRVSGDAYFTTANVKLGMGQDTVTIGPVVSGRIRMEDGGDHIVLGSGHKSVHVILNQGAAEGDVIDGFQGSNRLAGDVIEFVGFGSGATLASTGVGDFEIRGTDGSVEHFHVTGFASLGPNDVLFR